MRLRNCMPATCALVFLLHADCDRSIGLRIDYGFVKDPSGAVVPNAKVVIKNESTAEGQTVTTNESGYYGRFQPIFVVGGWPGGLGVVEPPSRGGGG